MPEAAEVELQLEGGDLSSVGGVCACMFEFVCVRTASCGLAFVLCLSVVDC